MKKAYLIKNITEYGKFIAYCIDKDISVFRCYWEEIEKGTRCYNIDFKHKQLYYSSKDYYEDNLYEIIEPIFELDEFGNFVLKGEKE